MEIYLVRHTTPDIAKGICYGQANIELASSFGEEYKTILEKLTVPQVDFIFSSPLHRCYQLSEKLAKHFNSTIGLRPHLKEVKFGEWELKAWNDIPKTTLQPWMEDFVNVAPPQGESFVDLQNRVVDCIDKIATLGLDKVIIVSHAGPIRAFLAHISNTDLKDAFSIKVEYGQVEKVSFKDGTFTWCK